MRKAFKIVHVLLFSALWAHTHVLSQESLEPFNASKSGTTFHILQKQLEESKKNPGNFKKVAQSYLKLGEYYHSFGLYSEAMEQYNKALEELGTELGDTLFITLNNNIGKVYLSLNNFELAEQHFTETMKASASLKMDKGLAMSLGLLGASHEKQGEYEEALKDQKESLKLFEKLGDEGGVAMTNENIGSVYEDLEQFDLAYEYFNRAYQNLKGTGTAAEINVLNNLGDTFRKTGKYEQALEKTSMALDIAKSRKTFINWKAPIKICPRRMP